MPGMIASTPPSACYSQANPSPHARHVSSQSPFGFRRTYHTSNGEPNPDRALSILLGLALALVVLLTASGCTTASLRLPGGASLLQPKDVTLKGLRYVAPDGSTLEVAEYTSSANVGAIQAQTALVQGVVGTAIQSALAGAPGK